MQVTIGYEQSGINADAEKSSLECHWHRKARRRGCATTRRHMETKLGAARVSAAGRVLRVGLMHPAISKYLFGLSPGALAWLDIRVHCQASHRCVGKPCGICGIAGLRACPYPWRRRYRIFCVVVVNGTGGWSLASGSDPAGWDGLTGQAGVDDLTTDQGPLRKWDIAASITQHSYHPRRRRGA